MLAVMRRAGCVSSVAEMPKSTLDLLFRCLRQNDGRLSRRAKEAEFEVLSEDEVRLVEDAYRRSFLER